MTDRIERELLVEASPTEVWTVVTGPGWLATEVEIDPVPGGEARFRSGEELRSGWIEEIRPPDGTYGSTARLVFWWAAGEEPASRVELTVECAGEDCTLVRVVEARPLDMLDVVGIPLPGSGGATYGPALLVAA